VVATAHKLVLIAWHMLRHNEPYRYAQPKTVEAKLARLRVDATGRRKRGGTPQGAPRSAAYGTGVRTRSVAGLDELYAGEQLPPLAPASQGERRMLARTGTAAYAEAIRRRVRTPRGRGPASGAAAPPEAETAGIPRVRPSPPPGPVRQAGGLVKTALRRPPRGLDKPPASP